MKYKEFVQWCSARAANGQWDMHKAISCANMIRTMQATPIWRRKKKWETIEPWAAQIVEICERHYSEPPREADR